MCTAYGSCATQMGHAIELQSAIVDLTVCCCFREKRRFYSRAFLSQILCFDLETTKLIMNGYLKLVHLTYCSCMLYCRH